MIVGLGVLFFGYSATYYGLSQLRGQNFGFLDLVLPGRWSKISQTTGTINDDGTYPFSFVVDPSLKDLVPNPNSGGGLLGSTPSATTPATSQEKPA